ncbi:MerR family transcriptional regulator [Lentzea sp. DG1S-22]|uniref:MerR family transcriptional regulator n=1 Tax=Lentzea sp. DG1S-22 TaxID=3108822 RepID=UPI002E78D4C6|nr:MerR family transcriptional regulator [Lentzea sp. DG1S-22]WVH82784.1 MerR family transcriptional regulator [Lentzea sp. DG1S-22]
MARALRPVDLARAAGISTQQVRNYLDDEVLPPAARSESGYRQFDSRHLEALLAYRRMMRGYGWDIARAMARAVGTGDVAKALELVDGVHAAQHERRKALRSMREALEVVAEEVDRRDPVRRSDLRIGEVAALLSVRASVLRVWEGHGLVKPRRDAEGYRRYNSTDVRDLRLIAMLRAGHYSLTQVSRLLEQFRETGSGVALRQALTQRLAELESRALDMLEAGVALHRYIAIRKDN